MKKQLTSALIAVILLHSLTGCATLLKGSHSEITLINAPDDLKIMTIEGQNIKIDSLVTANGKYIDDAFIITERSVKKTIQLKSSRDHILILKSGGKEKKYFIEGKVEWIWLWILGPNVIDAITGYWNYFDDIVVSFDEK